MDEQIQRQYYADTANEYNQMHVNEKDEHFLALSVLISMLDYFEIKSILDIGSGTGRAIKYIQEKRPDIHIIGIEPVRELRVAKKAIFISDSNNFGQGGFISRSLKQIINFIGMWKLADFIKTKGKGYSISEGDGLYYSYSVFNNFKQIKKHCKSVHLFNTINTESPNLYRSASHVVVFGLKLV